jgi:lipopolysaccharide biosynthesis glycosyltransferase
MNNPCCIALSFDRNMFHQAKECIQTIRAKCRHGADICVLALDLLPSQLEWLHEQSVIIHTDYRQLPTYKDFPLYAYAQICRPFLKEIFPGYLVYMWVDADIRFVREDAFDAFLLQAAVHTRSIVICQEIENCYICIHSTNHARRYHEMKNERLRALYGNTLVDKFKFYYTFNTGIWSMHRDSDLWGLFKAELLNTFAYEYNHMREQDALNVAIVNWNGTAINLPATMNWLCALSLPERDPESGDFVRPVYPHSPISVLHLIMSQSQVELDGVTIPFYELYKRRGFTT